MTEAITLVETRNREVIVEQSLPREVGALQTVWNKVTPILDTLKPETPQTVDGLSRKNIEMLFSLGTVRAFVDSQQLQQEFDSEEWKRSIVDPLGASLRLYIQPKDRKVAGDVMLTYIKGVGDSPESVELRSSLEGVPYQNLHLQLYQDGEYKIKVVEGEGEEARTVQIDSQTTETGKSVWNITEPPKKKT
ncbi:MAG TPA: hypothetical protein VE090_03225 [Methylomirabilota bacterium]|nr:hypothetical protein [Methylomirabilota bacterium]